MTPFDLSAQRAQLAARQVSAAELLADNWARARRPACTHAFARLFAATAQAQAQAVDTAHAAGATLAAAVRPRHQRQRPVPCVARLRRANHDNDVLRIAGLIETALAP